MGKRGPKPKPAWELARRGSTRARSRREQEQSPETPAGPVPASDFVVLPGAAQAAAPKTTPRRRKRNWRKLLALLPGYDCWRDAQGYSFDGTKADRVCDFFATQLRHVKGEWGGTFIKLEPWQEAWLGCLFGWVDKQGLRRFRETFCYIPRKNGKTTLMGGLLNYCLLCDGEPGAECYCAAADRDQASLVFAQARGMLEQNPSLSQYVTVYHSFKSVTYGESVARVISAEAASKHGFNSHLVIVDELHAQPNRDLVDVLWTSTGARRQPILVSITTADYDRPSICNEKYEYACKVRDGVIRDPRFLPVIYEAGNEEDWRSPEVWKRANPNLGVSISLEYLKAECAKAQSVPSYEHTFRRLHLNQRTRTDRKWLRLEDWDECAGVVDPVSLHGRECWAGLDLSATTDLSACVLLFPEPPGWLVLPFFWAPKEAARKRELRDRVPYQSWADAGVLELTPGSVIDYDRIRTKIRDELGKLYNIREIAIDRWNATQLATQLQGDGFTIVGFGQGFASMSAPTKEFEALVMGRRLAHGGNPLLRWMASNAVTEQDAAGNIKPTKAKSADRIDGIVAAIMALGRAMTTPAKQGSVYEQRDMITL